MLDMERAWWATAAGKEDVITAAFGVSPVRYYQQLDRLIDLTVALAYDPVTVNRLRRISSRRKHGRANLDVRPLGS